MSVLCQSSHLGPSVKSQRTAQPFRLDGCTVPMAPGCGCHDGCGYGYPRQALTLKDDGGCAAGVGTVSSFVRGGRGGG